MGSIIHLSWHRFDPILKQNNDKNMIDKVIRNTLIEEIKRTFFFEEEEKDMIVP